MTGGNEMNGLFVRQADSNEALLEPKPPTSPISEYVLVTLPQDLYAIQVANMDYFDLYAKQSMLLDEVSPLIAENADVDIAKVTQLDLGFMLGGYLPLGDDAYDMAPPQLFKLLEEQATRFGLPKRMDYELIIDINNREYTRTGQMRTFLNGNNALDERDFYKGHSESEPYIKAVASHLKGLADNPNSHDNGTTVELALADMKIFREYMGRYMHLTTEVFGLMRKYLVSYPDGTRNASGAFMPSVQLAELALHKPTEGQNLYISEALNYFPGWSRDAITGFQNDSAEGINVTDLVLNGQMVLSEHGIDCLIKLVEEFIRFRTTHLAVVRKQIPEAFRGHVPISKQQIREFGEPNILAGDVKGTAGFDVINVLAGAAHRLIITQDKLVHFRDSAKLSVN